MEPFDSLPLLPHERRWRGQTGPVAVVVALIRRAAAGGEELLLIRRAGGHYGGQWALVGGKWEFGETLAAAVAREVREETGLTTTLVALRAVVSERVAPAAAEEQGAHFLLLVCDLRVDGGDAAEQQEGLVAWFGAADIDALHDAGQIIPSDYAIIREFASAAPPTPYAEVEMHAAPSGQMVNFIRHDEADGEQRGRGAEEIGG